MGRILSDAQVRAYREDGYVFPIDVLSADEAQAHLARLEAIEAAHGGRLPPRLNQRPHLLFPFLADLIRHPKILDAVGNGVGLDDSALIASRDVLRRHGNCSSATVLLVLDELLRTRDPQRGEHLVALAFGPGLTLYAALLRIR